jgi:type IV secretion system protein VirB9
MTRLACVMACLALGACATIPPAPDTAVITAPPLMEAGRLEEPKPAPPPAPEPAKPPPAVKQAARRPVREPTPQEALAAANRAARQRPTNAAFEDATLLYAYEPGALYELHTAPAFISTILLEPGEALIDVAAGDTQRWQVSNTVSGAGAELRTLVMVKPEAANLRTNLVLVTDRRAYLIEAVSTAGRDYAVQIAWRYPPPPEPPAPVEEPDAPPRAINDGYRIRTLGGQARPPWTPLRVLDDGLKTWIEFPADIAASDMPPLFVRTGEGTELVNYRVRGAAYVVDRLFEVAELRLGQKEPIIVRIERKPSPRSRGKRS